MSRTLALGCLVAAALAVTGVLTLQGPAYASHLPTHGDVVLFDLNPTGQSDLLYAWSGLPAFPNPVVGGPSPTLAGSFGGGEFVDFPNFVQAGRYLHWETELTNPNTWWITFPTVFDWPSIKFTSQPTVGISLLAWVGLLPGWSVTVDMALPNFPAVYPPFPGWWWWAVGTYLPYPILVDASVTADKTFPPPALPTSRYTYSFHGPNGETSVPPALANKVYFRPYGFYPTEALWKIMPSYWLETTVAPEFMRVYFFEVYGLMQ